MKVYIDPGHGGPDVGATKYIVERDAALVISKACTEYLKAAGVTVKMAREDNNKIISIAERCAEANKWGADYYVSIHLNAGGGDGDEVFHAITAGVGKTLATKIDYQLKKLGQNSRGVKTKKNTAGQDHYAVIRGTKMPAVIVECAFVDNKVDVQIIDEKHEQEAFGYAIAKAILLTGNIHTNVYKTQANMNVRSQPTANGEKLTTIKKGSLIAANPSVKNENWLKISSRTLSGYICKKSSIKTYCVKL